VDAAADGEVGPAQLVDARSRACWGKGACLCIQDPQHPATAACKVEKRGLRRASRAEVGSRDGAAGVTTEDKKARLREYNEVLLCLFTAAACQTLQRRAGPIGTTTSIPIDRALLCYRLCYVLLIQCSNIDGRHQSKTITFGLVTPSGSSWSDGRVQARIVEHPPACLPISKREGRCAAQILEARRI
jgi:hypothetical protein